MAKYIKVDISYERLCEAIPEKYDGVTDINEMVEIEKEAFRDDSGLVYDLIMNETPKVKVEVVDL